MKNTAQKFEVSILRPLQIFYIALAIFFIINSMWFYLAGAIMCLFCLGIIGSNLHPHQSVSSLAIGPLRGSSAAAEALLLTPEASKALTGRACTYIGLLIGITSGVALWAAEAVHWYFAVLIFWLVVISVGASLKTLFETK